MILIACTYFCIHSSSMIKQVFSPPPPLFHLHSESSNKNRAQTRSFLNTFRIKRGNIKYIYIQNFISIRYQLKIINCWLAIIQKFFYEYFFHIYSVNALFFLLYAKENRNYKETVINNDIAGILGTDKKLENLTFTGFIKNKSKKFVGSLVDKFVQMNKGTNTIKVKRSHNNNNKKNPDVMENEEKLCIRIY